MRGYHEAIPVTCGGQILAGAGDFTIKTKSGKIIILETKGDDRDNSDSVRKLKLGNAWEKQAGRQFSYLMVFDNKPIVGAHKLADALGLLSQL